MDFKNRNVRLWSVISALILISLVTIYGLSWHRYGTIKFNPKVAWYAANLELQSIFSDKSRTETPYDSSIFKEVGALDAKLNMDEYQVIDTALITQSHNEMKNVMASMQQQNVKLTKDMDRLQKVNTQLLNSQSVLNSLNQEFSEIAAYQTQDDARQTTLDDLLADADDIPTEKDASALISASSRTGAQTSGIPQKVLNNVQQSTGISPEEINELMNQ